MSLNVSFTAVFNCVVWFNSYLSLVKKIKKKL